MSKKVIGALLALVMALSVFSLTVFAVGQISDESTTDAAKYTQTWSLSTPVQVGDSYQVKVYLKTNYPVGPVQFKLNNVSGATVTRGSGYYTQSEIKCSPSGLVILTPSTSAPLVGETFETAREIAVVTYTKGSADPVIDNSPKTIANPTGTLYAARLSGSTAVNSANLVLGQTVVIDGQTPTPPAGGTADLAKKSTAEAGVLIDTAHTFAGAYKGVVYGFTQKAANTFMNTNYLTTNLEATNGGSLVFSRSIGTRGYGTGTVITVKNADGTEACKYVVVIFGDVDCNGLTDTNDTAEVKKAASLATFYANNSIQRMASNCQLVDKPAAMMHTINTNDTAAVKANASGARLDQAALAAKMASLTANYK